MFRRATEHDIDRISEIYAEIHDEIEAGRAQIGWFRNIYPTRATAEEGVRRGDMYVLEEEGRITAAGRINQYQGPEYAQAAWTYDAPDARVLLLHTMVVSPRAQGRGRGTAFVEFYEQTARERGCTCLRLDTQAINRRARDLYARLGYREASIVSTSFNGIDGVRLVCLDKKLD